MEICVRKVTIKKFLETFASKRFKKKFLETHVSKTFKKKSMCKQKHFKKTLKLLQAKRITLKLVQAKNSKENPLKFMQAKY